MQAGEWFLLSTCVRDKQRSVGSLCRARVGSRPSCRLLGRLCHLERAKRDLYEVQLGSLIRLPEEHSDAGRFHSKFV